MTAQGIMNGAGSAMNAVFSGFPAVGGSVKGMQDASFEQFMETSKSGNEGVAKTPTYETGVKESSVGPKDIKERAKAMFSDDKKIQEAKPMQTEEPAEVSTEEAEAVSTLLVQVRQVICEALGITEEQLTGAMDELGMDDADLLNRESIQQLFLNVNQAEPTEFLTNETLFSEFTELTQAVEQTVEASGFTTEEVQSVQNLLKEQADVAEPVEQDVPEVTVKDTEKPVMEETVEDELPEDAQKTESVVEAKNTETTSEAKTDSRSTGDEAHTAQAKKDGDKVVVSSETDATVKDVFIDALANHSVTQTGEADLAAAAQVREIANQIMEQIKITIRPEQTNMELQLNPEHLGRVNLTITEKEGMMTAQFTTQTEVAKEAIESQMASLRESLQNQGIKVEAIEVTVSEFGFERDRQSEQSGNGEPEKRRKSGTFTVEETDEAAPKMADYLNVTDSSVDYSA